MAELSADTSSYLKPAMPVSPLDMAAKLGGMQQQALGINQQKLDQANQALGYMVRSMGSLGPNASKEDYAKAAQNAVDQGLVPQQQENIFLKHLQAAPDSQSFYKQFMSAAMEGQKQIELHTGVNSEKDSGDVRYQGKTSVLTGGFSPTTKLPIQIPPTTPGYNKDNQQVFKGASGPEGVQPASPAVAPQSRRSPLPVQPLPSVNQPAGSDASSFKAGPSPLFEEGKKQFTSDQDLATQKLTAVKPALLALDLIPNLRSGPGTKLWNEAVAALKSNGIISIDAKNDSTAVYQEVNKYLSQYLKGRGTRSDADLVAAEESSPNVGKQISPALLKLTQTAVAQDRIEAARHTQFKKDGQLRTDFQNYGTHRANFPAGMDERAFIVDKMTPEQRQDLAKDIAKMKPEEKQRFVNSLKVFEDSKVGGQ